MRAPGLLQFYGTSIWHCPDCDGVKVDEEFCTSVSGIYAAGDITHGSKLAIRAAAEGTLAAIGIYKSLMPEDRVVSTNHRTPGV